MAQLDDARRARPAGRAAADPDPSARQPTVGLRRAAASGVEHGPERASGQGYMIHERIVAEVERRRFLLNLSLLKTYAYYRVFVGIALLGVYLQPFVPVRIGTLNPTLFFWGSIAYCAINLVSAVTTNALPPRLFERQAITVVVVIVDVIALTCLTYLSSGVSSGLGVVLLISVAAASIFLEGRASTFVAAIATIAILYEEFYLGLSTR